MKRLARIARGAAVAGVAWAAACRLALPPLAHALVMLAPLLAVLGFGAYLLVLLIVGVLSFRTCPEEAVALHEDIKRAKAALKARGYEFEPDAGGDG